MFGQFFFVDACSLQAGVQRSRDCYRRLEACCRPALWLWRQSAPQEASVQNSLSHPAGHLPSIRMCVCSYTNRIGPEIRELLIRRRPQLPKHISCRPEKSERQKVSLGALVAAFHLQPLPDTANRSLWSHDLPLPRQLLRCVTFLLE